MRPLLLAMAVLIGAWGAGCRGGPAAPDLDRVLAASWHSYRQHFISPDGQVMVPERQGGTISEAQAYALLRAVWAGDRETFVRVYGWTYLHLSRVKTQGDHLLSWRWGLRPDGSRGVLDPNTATDGDLDYALALILAARRGWRPPPSLPDYGMEARNVMADILKQEVVELPAGELLLTPGNWHEVQPPYLINPSYFSPGAYQLFAAFNSTATRPPKNGVRLAVAEGQFSSPLRGEGRGGGEVTPSHQGRPSPSLWKELHQSTYRLLTQLTQGLGGVPGVGLFPDWCQVEAQGRVGPAPGRETRFGWEAVRLPFRVALDALWFREPRAAPLLREKFLPFFKHEWQARGKLLAVYHYDGTPAADYESPVLYAGVLAGALAAEDRDFARLLVPKILSFYREADGRAYFEAPDHYYANNWTWLGLALYAGWAKAF